MGHLLVIGGASLDVLHFNGETARSAGGAGMYTAMAAHCSGARVSLFAPRPEPMPPELLPVAARLEEWTGPAVTPLELPHFEISHHGGTAAYLVTAMGAEALLDPAGLSADLSRYDLVHVVPLGDACRQLEFVRACRGRGAPAISVGTYLDSIQGTPDAVRSLLAEADLFFLNRSEAEALFGSLSAARTGTGKVLFVTLGAGGARVIQGSHWTDIPPEAAAERDPTGAGDSFCGAVLAGLIDHRHPVMAAHSAARLAARVIEQVGPAALFTDAPPPAFPTDARVRVDTGRVSAVARLLAAAPGAAPFDFTGPALPPAGHARALDFFFASTLQQFGFWFDRDGRYERPLVAPLGNEQRKGSFYLFAAYLRRMEEDPGFLSPERQARLTPGELREVFRADDGSDPMPAFDLHLEAARRYGEDMLALGLSPEAVVHAARGSPRPVQALLDLLDRIGGYKEDPLRKKSGLLALVLCQRPERFLPWTPADDVPPVIDYHLMRSCLRTGMVIVTDDDTRAGLEHRRAASPEVEWAVRIAAYRAIQEAAARSGKPMGAVDWFFFDARRRCPEMSEPDCERCPLDPVCAHLTRMFQPVRRTTFY